MLLYKALQTEDEYERLQLLSEGIKEVTSEMPKIETIQSTALIKFLICCYPYQEQNINMLISAFFDYYKNENFFWAYTQAISQIGDYQESKAAAYKKQSIFDVYLRKQKEGKTGLNHFYHFSESVQQQMTKVKLYVCSYFSKYFSLAQDLGIDMSRIYDIYRIYLHNTSNKELIFELIESFENLKRTLFNNLPWIDTFQSEIDIYKQTLIPQRFSVKFKQNQHNLQQLYEQYKQQMENPGLQNQNSEENSPQVDQKAVYKQQIDKYQIALCKQNLVNLIDDSIDLYLFLKLIIKPQKYDLIDDWNVKYSETTIDKDYQGFKINCSELDDLLIIRSYKALNSVLNCTKFEILKLKMQNLLPKIFHLIYKVLRDPEQNINLYHLGSLINKLLEMCPKHTIYQIIKLNLLFSFTQFFYNNSIVNLVLEILDFDTDKYQLGYFVQEQVWTYINDTDWFQYLFTFLFKQNIDVSKKDENYQSERKTQVLSMLQSLNRNQRGSIKQQVTVNQSYFVQCYSTSEKLDELQPHDFLNNRDIDNLKFFNNDKLNFDPKIMEKMIEEQKKNQVTSGQNVMIEDQNIISQRVNKYGRQMIEIPPKKKQVSLPKLNTISVKSPLKNINSPLSRESSKNLSIDKDAQLSQKSKQSSSSLRPSDNQDDTLSQNKLIRIYQATSKTNASLFKQNQQGIQIKDIGLMESLQFIYRLLNSLQQFQKKFLSHKNCNIVEKTSKILTTENLVQFFQIFVSKIMKDDYGLICGQILNSIYQMVLNEHLDVYYEMLNEQFYNFIQEIGSQFILLEKQQNTGFKRYLISSIFFNGFILNNYLGQNYLEFNIYKYLSSKIFNQLQQYLINCPENNNYQLQFTKFLNCVFSKAPAYMIQQILFNYGLLQILFESQRVIILNDVQNVQSSLHYFAIQIIYLIKDLLNKRSMQVILDNLQPLDLWYKLCKATENFKIVNLDQIKLAEPPQEIRQFSKKQQRQFQFKKQQTEQKLEISERSPTELCLTPDLTHRTLKNYRLRKPFDL
ncbi:unnamed protein product [Paramecium primaurelia]|uniref:Uncharacterized protein n=1 Tax=Paramecium primaurelia TaxID=5886 RepID=A0A8S1NWD1_PARPR|nr:unnamed protein product [Paramecium primaurelia]